MNNLLNNSMTLTTSEIKQDLVETDDCMRNYKTISEQPNDTSTSIIKSSDQVTRIYACATMWHEDKNEMMKFLKSILRLDEDHSARRLVQNYFKIIDPDYYELETHIFFDDAIESAAHNGNEPQVNSFVKLLVSTFDEAVTEIYQTRFSLQAPQKFNTPYGARLSWMLPGKTNMVVHLKDKTKISKGKRWSQVMYMYYLLYHRLTELPISVSRKEVISKNTYILTLDGDVEFEPTAVTQLITLMKKTMNLGAVCGRVHPIGWGPIVWYQMFEYAIGHWFQKATEHVIGCVLCSPGCFSLFRAKALMNDNVMKRYKTKCKKARHYVQYDQGEDRWLCTLLLHGGYRIKYCAVSDAYTHAPESFNEFYNQRLRWIPSTFANVMDLLMNSKKIVKVNRNISMTYVLYQLVLTAFTVLSPGTIFLMFVYTCVDLLNIDIMISLGCNILPILFFIIVCFNCKLDIQLICAKIISMGYALFMTTLLINFLVQLGKNPSSLLSMIFLNLIIGSNFVAALLHPREFWCIMHAFIYFLLIPSMHLLLILYSIINLNTVFWGTREVLITNVKKVEEQNVLKLQDIKQKVNQFSSKYFSQQDISYNQHVDDTEEFDFAIYNLFNESCEIKIINENADRLSTKSDSPEKGRHILTSVTTSVNVSSASSNELAVQNEHEHIIDETNCNNTCIVKAPKKLFCINDMILNKDKLESLSTAEKQFWNDALKKYLHPLDKNEVEKTEIAKNLKKLRNQTVLTIIVINIVFVLIIFYSQLSYKQAKEKTDTLNSSMNVTIDGFFQTINPINFVFEFFFSIVFFIQFICMLFHRFGTLAQILKRTTKKWLCCRKVNDVAKESSLLKHATSTVKYLQRLDYLEDGCLLNSQNGTRTIKTLEDAFHGRLFSQVNVQRLLEPPNSQSINFSI